MFCCCVMLSSLFSMCPLIQKGCLKEAQIKNVTTTTTTKIANHDDAVKFHYVERISSRVRHVFSVSIFRTLEFNVLVVIFFGSFFFIFILPINIRKKHILFIFYLYTFCCNYPPQFCLHFYFCLCCQNQKVTKFLTGKNSFIFIFLIIRKKAYLLYFLFYIKCSVALSMLRMSSILLCILLSCAHSCDGKFSFDIK